MYLCKDHRESVLFQTCHPVPQFKPSPLHADVSQGHPLNSPCISSSILDISTQGQCWDLAHSRTKPKITMYLSPTCHNWLFSPLPYFYSWHNHLPTQSVAVFKTPLRLLFSLPFSFIWPFSDSSLAKFPFSSLSISSTITLDLFPQMLTSKLQLEHLHLLQNKISEPGILDPINQAFSSLQSNLPWLLVQVLNSNCPDRLPFTNHPECFFFFSPPRFVFCCAFPWNTPFSIPSSASQDPIYSSRPNSNITSQEIFLDIPAGSVVLLTWGRWCTFWNQTDLGLNPASTMTSCGTISLSLHILI